MSSSLVSNQTQKNWWTDAALLSSAVLVVVSSVYFLILPSGGFQGGRNPYYNIQILFSREGWDALHTWSGVAMIAVAAIHLALHWQWVASMARRTIKEISGQCGCLNARGRWNLALNALVALSFVLAAISGAYFLFFPGGRWAADPGLLFTRTTWDLIHTWAGVVFIAAAGVHLAIHWKWVTKVTARMARMALAAARPAGRPRPQPVTFRGQ